MSDAESGGSERKKRSKRKHTKHKSKKSVDKEREKEKEDTETYDSGEESEELDSEVTAEDFKNELDNLCEMQRKHRQELSDKVHRIKDLFSKGTISEDKLFVYLDRLEEVETTLNEDDLQTFVELGRKVLQINQGKRREALTMLYQASQGASPKGVAAWEAKQFEALKKDKLKHDEEELSKLVFKADYVSFSFEHYQERQVGAVDMAKFDCVFTDAEALAKETWTKLFHKEDSVTWPNFAAAFLGQSIPKTHKQYKALHIVLGEEITLQKFTNFLKWFGPKSKGDKLLKNVVHITKMPGFCGDVSTVEQENLIKEASVESYLIRFSGEPGDFTLVVRNATSSAMKLKIESGAGMPFKIAGKEYPTLSDLIEDNKKQLKLKTPVKGSKYELMWASHRKKRLHDNAKKLKRKGSHNELIEGNYQYINAFDLLEEAKKQATPVRKFSRAKSRQASLAKVADDFFNKESQRFCSCKFKKEGNNTALCSACLKINKEGPLTQREQEIVIARMTFLDDVSTYCSQMERNRMATFQAEVGIEEGEDGPGSARGTGAIPASGMHKLARKEVQILHNFSQDDSSENLEYDVPEIATNEKGSGRKRTLTKVKIKAATFEKLLEKMTSESYVFAEDDMQAFLMAHHLYLSSEMLLHDLELRYVSAPVASGIRFKVIQMCNTWFDTCRSDFCVPEVLERSSKFLKKVTSESISKESKELRELAIKLKEKLKAFSKELEIAGRNQPVNPLFFHSVEDQTNYLLSNLEEKKFPKPMMKRKGRSDLDVEKLDPCETARQLTLIDHYLLKKIKSSEFFGVAWEKKSKDIETPNIVNFIARFNQVTSWVTTEIVSRKSVKTRAALIEFFIDVAMECKEMKSYNVVMQVLFALKGNAIGRLTKTWEIVKVGHRAKYDSLTNFGSIMKNFNNYREEFSNANPPYVPFLNTTLKDLAGIDAIPSFVEGGKVNMSKVRKMAAAIQCCKKNAEVAYSLEPVQFVDHFLLFKLQVLDPRALYELSLQCEPKPK